MALAPPVPKTRVLRTGDLHPLRAARKPARHPIPDIEKPGPQGRLPAKRDHRTRKLWIRNFQPISGGLCEVKCARPPHWRGSNERSEIKFTSHNLQVILTLGVFVLGALTAFSTSAEFIEVIAAKRGLADEYLS